MRSLSTLLLSFVLVFSLVAPADAGRGRARAGSVKKVSAQKQRALRKAKKRSLRSRSARKTRSGARARAKKTKARRFRRKAPERQRRQRKSARKRRTVGPSGDPIRRLPGGKRGRIVFGVMGGAGEKTPEKVKRLVAELGAAIGSSKGVILTGAAPGIPDVAVRAARKKGALSVGISPYRTMADHKKAGAPTNFDVIKLTEHPALKGQKRPNYMGREIDNIEHSDAIIIAGGRFGTLGELAIALDERKPVGVLTGTGGMTNVVKQIVKASTRAGKPPGAPVVYDSNPQRLVQKLIEAKQRHDTTGKTGPLGDQ